MKMGRHKDADGVLDAQLAHQTVNTVLLQRFNAVFTGHGEESDDARHLLTFQLRSVARVDVAQEVAEDVGVGLFDEDFFDGHDGLLLEHGGQDGTGSRHDLRVSHQLFTVHVEVDVAERLLLQQRRQVIDGNLGPVPHCRFQVDVHGQTGDFQLELSAAVGAQFVDVVLFQYGRPLLVNQPHSLAGDAVTLRLDHVDALHRVIRRHVNNDLLGIGRLFAVHQRARERPFSDARRMRQISATTATAYFVLDEVKVGPQFADEIHLPKKKTSIS